MTHRKHKEEASQKEFVDSKKKLLMEQERLARLEGLRTRHMEALEEKQRDGVTVSDVVLYDNYIKQVSRDINQQIKKVIELERQLRDRLSQLIASMKDRKILDRLKEKELETYRRELERKERTFMSEIAISKFNMRKQA